MALFIISIPLMLGAVALAVIPLLVTSRSQHRRTVEGVSRPPTIAPREATWSDDPAMPMAA